MDNRNGTNIGGQLAQSCPLNTNHNCSQDCKESLLGIYCKHNAPRPTQDFDRLHHPVLSTDSIDMRDTLASSSDPISPMSKATPRTSYDDTLSALSQLQLPDDSDSESSCNYTISKSAADNNGKEKNLINSTYTSVYGTSTELSNPKLSGNPTPTFKIGDGAPRGIPNQRLPTTSQNGEDHFQEQTGTQMATYCRAHKTQNIVLPSKQNEPPILAQPMSSAEPQDKTSETHRSEVDDIRTTCDFHGNVRGVGSWINNTGLPEPDFEAGGSRLGDDSNFILENVNLENVRKCAGSGQQPNSIGPYLSGSSGSNYQVGGRSIASHTNGNADEEQADGGGSPGGSRPGFRSPDNTKANFKFACPFHKRYPRHFHQGTTDNGNINYRTCAGPGFNNVSRVKEHLYRKHKIPLRCVRCGQPFQDQSLLDQHLINIDQVGCIPRTFQAFCGLTPEMESNLRTQRHRKGQTEEEKWRDVYSFLFQVRREHIPSPYYDASEYTQSRASQHHDNFMYHGFIPLFESRLGFLPPNLRQNVLSALHSCIAQTLSTGPGGQGAYDIGMEHAFRATFTSTSMANSTLYPNVYTANYGVSPPSIQNIAPNSQPLPVLLGLQAWHIPQSLSQPEPYQPNFNTYLDSPRRQGSDSGIASTSSCGNCGNCSNCSNGTEYFFDSIAPLDLPFSAPVGNGQHPSSF